ncbi:Fur-regulated basic protein FbpA [Domibacillus epiphyticus]|nr:Fur-regulated basic protein FbpA [Domibacillus epiphyticus]
MQTTEKEQMKLIERLMEQGIFKYGDRQLYELTVDELIYLNESMDTSINM